MQTMLRFLVTVGILLQIQVRNVYSNSNGPAPTGLWSFRNTLDVNNNPEEASIRDHRSVPRFYESYDVPHFYPSFRQYPQSYESYENRNVVAPHLSVRRSVPKLPKQKELKPNKPAQTSNTPKVPDTTEENIDRQFLTHYALDLDKVAYNTAKYMRLSITIIFEHAKCLFDIVKISLQHIIRKIKLLLRNPLQLIFLPFSLPVDMFRFAIETSKFIVSLMKYLFTKP